MNFWFLNVEIEFTFVLSTYSFSRRSSVRLLLEQHWAIGGPSTSASNLLSIVPDLDDALEESRLTLLHRMILGLIPGNLAEQLDDDDSLIDASDLQGWTPLYLATFRNDIEALRILLARNAKPAIKNRQGEMPLHFAAFCGWVEGATALLEQGAPAAACDRVNRSPLHWAAWSSNSPALAELLIQRGANPNAVDCNNDTPLVLTMSHDHSEVARILLDHGANLEACNLYGQTPTMEAIWQDAVHILEMLLQAGARFDRVTTSGRNVLHTAALSGSHQTLKVLLDANLKGVDPLRCDNDGRTPLDYFYFDRQRWVETSKEVPAVEDWELFNALLARTGCSAEEIDGQYHVEDGDVESKYHADPWQDVA